MKIGFAIEEVQTFGGTSRCTVETAKYMSKTHEINFIVKAVRMDQFFPFKAYLIKFGTNLKFIGQIVFAIQSSLKAKRLNLDLCVSVGSNAFVQDIVIAHSVHKKWFKWSIDESMNSPLKFFKKILNPAHYLTILIETLQYKSVNTKCIIAVSHLVKKDLVEQFNLPEWKIKTVYNGVNMEEFSNIIPEPSVTKIASEFRETKDDILLLFVAHEFKRKGLSIVLQAMSQLPSKYKLVVAGQDNPKPYICEAAELGLEKRVKFVGLQKKIAPWYQACDVFVLPTSYEAFGLVITEAMAAGLPVIVPCDAGAAELIADGKDGLLLPRWDDVGALVQQLSLLEDVQTRKQIGHAAREKAASHTWDHAAKLIQDIFEDVYREKNGL